MTQNVIALCKDSLYAEAQNAFRRVFTGSDFDVGNLYNPSYNYFLFCTPYNITLPHHLLDINFGRVRPDLFIGYLKHVEDLSSTADDHLPRPIFFVPSGASEADIAAAFDMDPGFPEEGPLGFYVRSGFVVSRSDAGFGIWFSLYWEIAIIGFSSRAEASRFADENFRLDFLDNQSILRIYDTNLSSAAPRLLAPYLANNEHVGGSGAKAH